MWSPRLEHLTTRNSATSMLRSWWCYFIPFFSSLAITVHNENDLAPHLTLHNRRACQGLWGRYVLSRALVHGAGTTCSSVCADTRTGAWFFCHAYRSPGTSCVKTSLLMALKQHESVQSARGQHIPIICLALSRIWAAVHPAVTGGSCTSFRFQIHIAHRCCCRYPTMMSSLAALDCCLNHQLMIRSHRQERRSLFAGHE